MKITNDILINYYLFELIDAHMENNYLRAAIVATKLEELIG